MKNVLSALVVAALLSGCAATPQAPEVTSSGSKVTTVQAGGTTRTEEYARSSHADANGAQAATHQKAEQTNPDGSVSAHSSDLHTDSNAQGVAQDEHHLVVSGSGLTREFTVNGQDLAVSGNNNHLIFRGQAHGLSVTGNDNQVEVENASLIEALGERNKVAYSGPAPQIKQEHDSTVTAR